MPEKKEIESFPSVRERKQWGCQGHKVSWLHVMKPVIWFLLSFSIFRGSSSFISVLNPSSLSSGRKEMRKKQQSFHFHDVERAPVPTRSVGVIRGDKTRGTKCRRRLFFVSFFLRISWAIINHAPWRIEIQQELGPMILAEIFPSYKTDPQMMKMKKKILQKLFIDKSNIFFT